MSWGKQWLSRACKDLTFHFIGRRNIIITIHESTPLRFLLVVIDGPLPARPHAARTLRRRGLAPAQLGRAGHARVEVDPLVEVAHLDVARLLLVVFVGEVAEALRGHPQQVDDLPVVRVVHEDLDEALDEPGPAHVVPVADVAGDGGVGDDHVLPGGPCLVHLPEVVDRVGVLAVPSLLAGGSRLSEGLMVVVEVSLVGVIASTCLKEYLRNASSPLISRVI